MYEDVMAVMAMFNVAIATMKGAGDLATQIRDDLSGDEADLGAINDRLLKLQGQLMQANEMHMAVKQELMKLKEAAAEADQWTREAVRYRLERTDMGGVVYALKPGSEGDDAPHELCARCFQERKKRHLQPVAFNTLGCTECGERVLKSDGQAIAVLAPVRRRDPFDGW